MFKLGAKGCLYHWFREEEVQTWGGHSYRQVAGFTCQLVRVVDSWWGLPVLLLLSSALVSSALVSLVVCISWGMGCWALLHFFPLGTAYTIGYAARDRRKRDISILCVSDFLPSVCVAAIPRPGRFIASSPFTGALSCVWSANTMVVFFVGPFGGICCLAVIWVS